MGRSSDWAVRPTRQRQFTLTFPPAAPGCSPATKLLFRTSTSPPVVITRDARAGAVVTTPDD